VDSLTLTVAPPVTGTLDVGVSATTVSVAAGVSVTAAVSVICGSVGTVVGMDVGAAVGVAGAQAVASSTTTNATPNIFFNFISLSFSNYGFRLLYRCANITSMGDVPISMGYKPESSTSK
jgi:hypothetical protein